MRLNPLLVVLIAAMAWSISFANGDDRPNILLIVSEDNGPEIGCYGDPSARTPHLDRLASEGILFKNAYVPQAGCSQSRASFLTGRYPHQHGQIGLATWGFQLYREDAPNLVRQLKSVGYRTGLIGKLHINPASAFPFDMHEITSANFSRKQMQRYREVAQAFMLENDEPFFLSVNYPDAHDPWIRQIEGLPKEPQTIEDVKIMPYMGVKSPELQNMVADYYNCISRLDSLIGDLLQTLERVGKAENTIVVYIGDHGADMLRGKRTCYEGGLRIPMLIRWPGQIQPQVRDELVSTLDLTPTFLEAASAPPIADLPGAKLQALFQPGDAPWRVKLFAEYHTHAAAPNYFPQRSVRDRRYKLIETLLPRTTHPDYQNTIDKLHGDFIKQKYPGALDLQQVIESAPPSVREAYATMQAPPRYLLFDLQVDPYEFHNLADDPKHAQTLRQLVEALRQWRVETDDPLLDATKLEKLTAEVQAMKNKTASKAHQWEYPTYLLEQ